jgi:hypothetical protein
VPHICPVLADVGFHRAGPAAFATATDTQVNDHRPS